MYFAGIDSHLQPYRERVFFLLQKMVDTTVDKFGQIDCVINNAAYSK